MKQKYSFFMAACCLFFASQVSAEEQTESLYFNGTLSEPESYYLSEDDANYDGIYFHTDFSSGSFSLNHSWVDWGFGDGPEFGGGFTYSNGTDLTTPGYSNLSAYAGTGQSGDTYLIANSSDFIPAEITFTDEFSRRPLGAYFTNSSYAALVMLHGNSFAKKFGGESGTDEDWFLLTITGYDVDGEVTNTVDFYLADYRFEDSSEDYIVRDWTWVDLTSLGEIRKLGFSMTSSDNHDIYGMNTPSYFCMDGLVIEALSGTGMEINPSLNTGEAYYSDGQLFVNGLQGTIAGLYNINGTCVQNFSIESDSFHTTISLSNGIYVLKTIGSGSRAIKIVVNK